MQADADVLRFIGVKPSILSAESFVMGVLLYTCHFPFIPIDAQ